MAKALTAEIAEQLQGMDIYPWGDRLEMLLAHAGIGVIQEMDHDAWQTDNGFSMGMGGVCGYQGVRIDNERELIVLLLTALGDRDAILTTGAAPRCPKCDAEVWKPFPLHDGDTGVVLDPLLTVHCNGTVCGWQGDLQEALAHGNRVALRAREVGGAT